MTTIRFNFAKFNLATAFQITEQDPAFIGKKFIASNGFSVRSAQTPSINKDTKTIYVRGTNEAHNTLTTITYFDTNTHRDAFYDGVLEAISELTKNKDKWENN